MPGEDGKPTQDEKQDFLQKLIQLSKERCKRELGEEQKEEEEEDHPINWLKEGDTYFNGLLIRYAMDENEESEWAADASSFPSIVSHQSSASAKEDPGSEEPSLFPQSTWTHFFGAILTKGGHEAHFDKGIVLIDAIQHDQLGAVQSLGALFSPEEINRAISDEIMTPLTRSILFDCSNALVSYLILEMGADINRADEYGWSPLALAACHDNHEVLLLLLDLGADLNQKLDIEYWNVTL